MRASSPSRALGLLAVVAVAQAPLRPSLAHAAPAASPGTTSTGTGTGTGTGTTGTSTPATSTPAPTSTAITPPPREPPTDPAAPPPTPSSTEPAQTGKPLQDAPSADANNQPAIVAPPNNVSPTAGMGGRLISATDPEARRAKAELEGTALDKNPSADVPKRLHPQQRAAWWCMFGAFALGSAAGVFAGLAEVQEDKATRLAITLDSETGSALLYADTRAEYEDILRVGRRDAAVAKGLLAGAGGFLVGGIALFIVHAVKSRKASKSSPRPGPAPIPARVGVSRGGLEVRF